MNQELQQKLYEKYPKIFKQKDLSMKESCMFWGIETGNGWFNLIDILCGHLQFHTDRNNYPQVEATQVKEKYGGLRFYYTLIPLKGKEHTDRQHGCIDGLISFAEYLSGYICENCGSNKNVTQTEGWITTLCEDCMKKYKEDDND